MAHHSSPAEPTAVPHHHDIPTTNEETQQANRTFFDDMAHDHGHAIPEWAKDLSQAAGEAILKAYDFKKDETSVLEFACGSGYVSQVLAPHAQSITGVDISQGQVDLYNKRAADLGYTPDQMKAICATWEDLDTKLGGAKFDLVVCAQSYHHFTDINLVTRILVSFLKPSTGKLIVLDGVKSEAGWKFPVPKAASFSHAVIAHRGGFSQEEIENVFKEAGLEDVEFDVPIKREWEEFKIGIFLVKGRAK
ncbi:S-adenosyl-L-methionine-dependent methyltransferase [Sistotremastrum niveocremeum HHB9708]|uniref:S-adenosyl-L-methionine-dependent methyltransferase n=1 Tax=Sistotremastrum niveocremeum HHB9708 TaxID=1314777 RepID=A0A165ADX7_9AGAM|nr:S-adenosyl-L-methionine-dependent methyltransferase [Sistotremastrum niveocremeum HHB9708]